MLNNCLCIFYQKFCSLRTKLSNLHTSFVLSTIHIYTLTETWHFGEKSDAEFVLDGHVIFRCDRNINTSVSQRNGGILIAVKTEFKLFLILSPVFNVERVFVLISLLSGAFLLLRGINLTLRTDILSYESHAEAVNHILRSYKFDFEVIYGDFNLSNVKWVNSDISVEYERTVTDKV